MRLLFLGACKSHYLWEKICGGMSIHKYAAELRGLPGCPPQCDAASGVAYRFVRSPITGDDFVPTAIKYPEERAHCCAAWGISLFESDEAASKKYNFLIKKYPNIHKDLGDHLASGALLPSHGGVTVPDARSGHFCLHEYAGTDLVPAFKIVRKL